ncbi:hypothetical protein COZ45_04430, partial [Candidatus Uhrbacteria bacterium CG_4_10_14_3_um_filter_41_21]
FSAPASFIASAAIGTVGIGTVKKAKKKEEYLLAFIPILFAIQQLIEGTQWLLDKPSVCSDIAGYSFLFFAFLLWPFYVPLAFYLIEPNVKRKKILKLFAVAGAACSLFLFATLLINPLNIHEVQNSIAYGVNIPVGLSGLLIYVIATSGSAMVSSFKMLQIFGILTLVFLILTLLSYSHALTSVWCFFSAILSSIIYLHFTKYEELIK